MFGKIKDYLVYLLLKSAAVLIWALPAGLAFRLGEWLGEFLYRLDRRHRRVALDNLHKVWGEEKSRQELEKIARGCFRNLTCSFVEFCRFPRLDEDNIRRCVQMQGWEHFEKARRSGRGVFVATAHFGNWELMATAIALRECPSNIVVRPLDNFYLDRLVNENRMRFGNRIIPKKKALKEVLRALQRGETVAMLMDQSTAPREAVVADFFARPCYTLVTPAMLALKTNCVLLAAFIIREGRNRHRIIFTPELELVRSGDRRHDLQVNTQRLNDLIEEYVRRYPENWLWVHRRWKF